MDIVFEHFSIRKMTGRVDYRWTEDISRDYWHESMAADARSALEALSAVSEHALAEYDRESLLTARLFTCAETGDLDGVRTLARQIVAGTDGHASFAAEYAVYLLGFHGDAGGLPALTQLLFRPDAELLTTRNTRDAIERILERGQIEPHP